MKEEMKVSNQRYRLGYHLMTKGGWMNDPNGFSYFKGFYHMFYQYYPYAAEWGPMHWGHARSKDLIHWETLPTALTPGDMESGCFSGSAVVYDDKLWLIYTGHHYIELNDSEAFYQNQNLAYSEDGINFTKYEGNPVLRAPKDNTKHFRDPKVWQDGDNFYMVLGSQEIDGLGRALLYSSTDLKKWEFVSTLAKAKNLKDEGYMWECPDFFNLDGKDILLMSPQGLEANGDLYRNLNQTGYLIGNFDKSTNTLKHSGFVEIDRGHDFYATQTMLTPDGRRVMIAWMNAWDSPMYEKQDGWAGALTIPRELHVINDKIYQRPIDEIKSIRQEKVFDGALDVNKKIAVPRTSEVQIQFKEIKSDTLLKITDGTNSLTLMLDMLGNRLILNRTTKDGERAATVENLLNLELQCFIDVSSVEIFVNDGELTFTERMYWDGELFLINEADASNNTVVYKLEPETNSWNQKVISNERKHGDNGNYWQ